MLKRVSIQNFKSLKDVTLDLQKVNLLIGPNNSGKTNFLKALEFCYDSHSVTERKQYNKFKFTASGPKPIEEEDNYATYFEYIANDKYLLDTTVFKRDQRLVIDISLFLSDYQIDRQAEIQWSSAHKIVKFYIINDKENSYVEGINAVTFMNSWLGSIIIYKPDPNKLDKPGPVGRGDDSVSADASNLIAFFDRIRDEYPEAYAQIKADLVKCVPEFTEINFQNVESTAELVKQFGDKTFKRIGLTDGRQKTIYWADELSEGTLYFIALLCIINQPNPPKLLLLEEPEKGIHPRRIHEVIQFILRLVEEKDIQVIMTTHSPLLLDEFAESPESVFVFDKDVDGATIVQNLQRDIIKPANEKNAELGIPPVHYTDALGEYWTIGFLGGVPHETA